MPAFRAPEKPHFAFICSPELAEPPDCKIVFALRALDLDGGHGLFLSLFLNNYDLILAAVDLARHLVSSFYFPDISAFPALQTDRQMTSAWFYIQDKTSLYYA